MKLTEYWRLPMNSRLNPFRAALPLCCTVRAGNPVGPVVAIVTLQFNDLMMPMLQSCTHTAVQFFLLIPILALRFILRYNLFKTSQPDGMDPIQSQNVRFQPTRNDGNDNRSASRHIEPKGLGLGLTAVDHPSRHIRYNI